MEKQKNMNYHRKKTATIAMLLALILMLTGTFAWYSISQRALNEGQLSRNPGGRVHDDYHFQDVLNEVSDVANKDIYAENFGETNLLVRMKVSEYLEIDRRVITGGSKEDRSTWVPYVLGNTERARNFVEWQMGGDKIFLPTFNIDQESLETDAKGDAIDQIAGVATGIGDGSVNYFAPAGTHFESDGTKVDTETQTSHTSKSTLIQDREVISMETWLTLNEGEKTGNFWVVDADGWAYWANFLEPGQATSLLVDQLTFNGALVEETLYYATDAIGEFATAGDIYNFYNGRSEHGDASSDAQDLLDTISGTTYTIQVPQNITLDKGQTQSIGAAVYRETILGERIEITDTNIEYTLSGMSTVTEDGVITIDANETETTLLLEIRVPRYNLTETVTITVPVVPSTAGQVFQDVNGIAWRVIVPDDGNGNALIITENVHNAITYNSTNAWAAFESSNLRTNETQGMDTWFAESAGDDIKGIALEYAYPEGAYAGGAEMASTGSGWSATANLDIARTIAGNASTVGEGNVFAMSVSEVNHYAATEALNTVATNTSGTASPWWLRSPGVGATGTMVSGVNADGTISNRAGNASIGFRAALWVRK